MHNDRLHVNVTISEDGFMYVLENIFFSRKMDFKVIPRMIYVILRIVRKAAVTDDLRLQHHDA